MIQFVTTPTNRWITEHVLECESGFLVSSPYVGAFLPPVMDEVVPSARRTLLTRTDLRDFAMGASDIEALCHISQQGGEVLSCSKLHAKVYIVDEKRALVTSANATHGGMYRNWECGVRIDDAASVRELTALLLNGLGANDRPQPWTLAELRLLRGPIQAVRERLPPVRQLPELDASRLPTIQLSRRGRSRLLDGFSGWAQLTLEGVLAQSDDTFTLDALVATCSVPAAAQFPRNRNVRPKLRQQLQRLRDLGLVEFLGGGRYRRTVEE